MEWFDERAQRIVGAEPDLQRSWIGQYVGKVVEGTLDIADKLALGVPYFDKDRLRAILSDLVVEDAVNLQGDSVRVIYEPEAQVDRYVWQALYHVRADPLLTRGTDRYVAALPGTRLALQGFFGLHGSMCWGKLGERPGELFEGLVRARDAYRDDIWRGMILRANAAKDLTARLLKSVVVFDLKAPNEDTGLSD